MPLICASNLTPSARRPGALLASTPLASLTPPVGRGGGSMRSNVARVPRAIERPLSAPGGGSPRGPSSTGIGRSALRRGDPPLAATAPVAGRAERRLREALSALTTEERDRLSEAVAALEVAPLDAAPGAGRAELHDRIHALFQSGALDLDAQLLLLEKLPPAERACLLDSLAASARDRILHRTSWGPSFRLTKPCDFDWATFDGAPARYCARTAWGMSVLSLLSYSSVGERPPGARPNALRALLEPAGFEVHDVGTDELPGTVSVRGDVVLVALRGTANQQAMLTDLDMLPTKAFGGRVHSGFKKAIDRMWPSIERAFDEIQRARQGTRLRVHTAGHSLGGALASLVAFRLAKRDAVAIESVYMFGAPRFVDRDSATEFVRSGVGRRIWSVVHPDDPVIQLPPASPLCPYRHLGEPILAGQNGMVGERTSRSLATPHEQSRASPLDHHDAGGYVVRAFLSKDVSPT